MKEIDDFLDAVETSGYQRVVLPTGRVIPGRDLSPLANLVFPESLAGKTILDAGCYYGYFLHEAVRRGATKAVGLEPDPDRFRVANTIAPLWDGKIEVRQETIEELTLSATFDYVLCLRVIHHVADPFLVMRSLRERCRGKLVVVFREPHDIQFSRERYRKRESPPSMATRLKMRVQSQFLRLLDRDLGIIGVGSTRLERGYYFSKEAFRKSFLVHTPLFERIEFRSTHKPGLALAVCECHASSPT